MGNKNDMYNEEKVTKQEAVEYTKSINGTYRCVSALSSNGIKELFDCVGETLLTNKRDEPPSAEEEKKPSIILDKKNNKKKGGKERKKCC